MNLMKDNKYRKHKQASDLKIKEEIKEEDDEQDEVPMNTDIDLNSKSPMQ